MAPNNAAISQQRVAIPNRYGKNLIGVLHSTGSKNVVVLCHGFRSTKEDRTILNLTTALTSQGISAFRFDFSGNGESEGEFQFGNYQKEAEDLHAVIQHPMTRASGHGESEGEFQFGNYQKEAEDLHAVIQHLSETHDVTAILGHSKGGDVVLLYASIYHDVHMVINVSGRFALEGGLEDRFGKEYMQRIKKDGFIDVKDKNGNAEFRVTEESLMERLSIDMHAASLSINKECRVLTVHGSKDEIIPVGDALEFAKVISNHKLHVIVGANHCYTAHQEQLCSVVLDFVKSNQVFSRTSETMATSTRL